MKHPANAESRLRTDRPARAPGRMPILLVCVLACSLCGCVEVEDHLTINPDGSGTVLIRMTPHLDNAGVMHYRLHMARHCPRLTYPPHTIESARTLFSGADAEVKFEKRIKNDQDVFVTRVSFKDINRLLRSPYGEAHSLQLNLDGEKGLTFRALTGMQGLTCLDALTTKKALQEVNDNLKGLTEQRKKLRVVFKVTFPNPVKADGAVVAGKTATWVVDAASLEPAKPAAGAAEPDGAATPAFDAFTRVLSASCPGEGIKFKPVSPARLDLCSFDEVKEGHVVGKATQVDGEKIRTQTKFIPLVCAFKRVFHISGTAHEESQGFMVGTVVLPEGTPTPMRWGAPQLTQVIDDSGESLLQAVDDYERSRMMQYQQGFGRRRGMKVGKIWLGPHRTVVVPIGVPELNVKTLRRLKGTIELHYSGVPYLLKVKDALKPPVPPKDIEMETNPSTRTELAHPKLKELGIEVWVYLSSHRSGGVTNLNLTLSEKRGILGAIQVFDADGRPWPTYVQRSGSDAKSAEVLVTGYPKGPLSLSAIVTGTAGTIKVPFVLEDIPITPNSLKPDKDSEKQPRPTGPRDRVTLIR